MADYTLTDTVDITDVVCPVTFVKAKVALEELEHVSCVTNDDIVVETVFFTSLFHLLLCQALFSCLDVNDVAGSQIHDEVDDEGDADYHRDQLQQSSDGIP